MLKTFLLADISKADGDILFLKVELKRNHPSWPVPIDKVCDQHREGGAVQHVIMPARGENTDKYFCETVSGSSVLYYLCSNPVDSDGSLTETFAIWFPCTNSCPNSTTHSVLPEPSRDTRLTIELEKRTPAGIRSIFHVLNVNVWLRSKIVSEYLAQDVRFKPKGAAAPAQQSAAKKRKAEVPVIKTELEQEVSKLVWLQQGKRMFQDGVLTQEDLSYIQAP